MHVIRARNVCEALPLGLAFLLSEGRPEPSRAGDVIVAPCPVTTVYERPTERVLTSPVRDANPFFHLFEALWMLAGRNDGKFLDRYVKDFSSRFGDDGGAIHGAYGYRWRSALGFDQLDVMVAKLRANPSDRQCVLQMWDASEPRSQIGVGVYTGMDDLRGTWRDRPCNTHAYLRVRQVEAEVFSPTFAGASEGVLDLTVLCRSNDIVMGAYGANAVHFSVLQEYLAARIGVGVGRLYQVSNNFHAYAADVERLRERSRGQKSEYPYRDLPHALMDGNVYAGDGPRTVDLVHDASVFDDELGRLMEVLDSDNWSNRRGFRNVFLDDVALQMHNAHVVHRCSTGAAVAAEECARIAATDWRTACEEWLRRRVK